MRAALSPSLRRCHHPTTSRCGGSQHRHFFGRGGADGKILCGLVSHFSLPFFPTWQEPFPTPLAESIKRMADLFTKLKDEGRLHDRDLE